MKKALLIALLATCAINAQDFVQSEKRKAHDYAKESCLHCGKLIRRFRMPTHTCPKTVHSGSLKKRISDDFFDLSVPLQKLVATGKIILFDDTINPLVQCAEIEQGTTQKTPNFYPWKQEPNLLYAQPIKEETHLQSSIINPKHI